MGKRAESNTRFLTPGHNCRARSIQDIAACATRAPSAPSRNISPVPSDPTRATFDLRRANITKMELGISNIVRRYISSDRNGCKLRRRVTQDLIDGGAFLQRTLGDDFSALVLHEQHKGIQWLFNMNFFLFILRFRFNRLTVKRMTRS